MIGLEEGLAVVWGEDRQRARREDNLTAGVAARRPRHLLCVARKARNRSSLLRLEERVGAALRGALRGTFRGGPVLAVRINAPPEGPVLAHGFGLLRELRLVLDERLARADDRLRLEFGQQVDVVDLAQVDADAVQRDDLRFEVGRRHALRAVVDRVDDLRDRGLFGAGLVDVFEERLDAGVRHRLRDPFFGGELLEQRVRQAAFVREPLGVGHGLLRRGLELAKDLRYATIATASS